MGRYTRILIRVLLRYRAGFVNNVRSSLRSDFGGCDRFILRAVSCALGIDLSVETLVKHENYGVLPLED